MTSEDRLRRGESPASIAPLELRVARNDGSFSTEPSDRQPIADDRADGRAEKSVNGRIDERGDSRAAALAAAARVRDLAAMIPESDSRQRSDSRSDYGVSRALGVARVGREAPNGKVQWWRASPGYPIACR